MRELKRWALAILVWFVTASVFAPLCFYGALALAGPHASLVPAFLQPVVLLLGWAVFLAGPPLVARAAWRRSGRRAPRRSG